MPFAGDRVTRVAEGVLAVSVGLKLTLPKLIKVAGAVTLE